MSRSRGQFSLFILLVTMLVSSLGCSDNSTGPEDGRWVQQESGTSSYLYDIWGTSADNVFVVGGGLLHYDGSCWSNVNLDTLVNLWSIWGSSEDNIFAVGEGGAILHFNGSTWNVMTSGTTADLVDVYGAAPTDVYAAASDGEILHFDGQRWRQVVAGGASDVRAIWVFHGFAHPAFPDSMLAVFATGSSGVRYYDGTQWMYFSGVQGGPDFWGLNYNNLYALTGTSDIIHFNGSSFEVTRSNLSTTGLRGIWGTSEDNIFVVGLRGKIFHFNGGDWNEISSNTEATLIGVWGSPSGDVFVVGSGGTILHNAP